MPELDLQLATAFASAGFDGGASMAAATMADAGGTLLAAWPDWFKKARATPSAEFTQLSLSIEVTEAQLREMFTVALNAKDVAVLTSIGRRWGGYVFQLQLQADASPAAGGGCTLGAFVRAGDGVNGTSGAVAHVKDMHIFKGVGPPPRTAGKVRQTFRAGLAYGLSDLLDVTPMTGGTNDAAALAPHLDRAGKLRVSAVVRALG